MRRLVMVVLIVAAALVLLVLALPALINANRFRPAIESELTKSLGRDVKIGDLGLSVWSGTVSAGDLSVADDSSFSRAAFLTAKGVTLSIDLWKMLFSHQMSVGGINIDTPEIALIQAPSGVWNFSSLGAHGSAQTKASSSFSDQSALSIKSIRVRGAHILLTQGGGKPESLDQVSITVTDFAPGSAFPFTVSARITGGGDVALEGKAGPLPPDNAASMPLTATLKMKNLNLAASGALPRSSGIDGVVSLDGAASSNGQVVEVTGQLKAEKLKLAPGAAAARNPLMFDIALTADLRQHSGKMTRGDVAIGGVKAGIAGTWSQVGGVPALNMILAAQSVPVSGLVDLLPALGIGLPAGSTLEGGTASARLAISGPASAVVVSGPVSVRETRLNGFNLGAKMSVLEKLAGLKSGPSTEIQSLSASLRMAPQGTSLRDIHLVLPAVGELTGGGTISPNHTLSFRMTASIHSGALPTRLTASSIPFSITGTSSDPQFQPDVGQLAVEEITRGLKGGKVGGVDAGKAADSVLQGLFGGKQKK